MATTYEHYCTCPNNMCLKKYCVCFKAGVHCNKGCICIDCKNTPKIVNNQKTSKKCKKRKKRKKRTNYKQSSKPLNLIKKSDNKNKRVKTVFKLLLCKHKIIQIKENIIIPPIRNKIMLIREKNEQWFKECKNYSLKIKDFDNLINKFFI